MKKGVLGNFTGKHLWFAKFSKTPFLQNTSGRLLLLLAFQKQPPEALYEKRYSWKFRKIHRETPLVCKIFKNTFFTEHLRATTSAFSSSEAATGGALCKISQNSQENTFGLRNFHLFGFAKTPIFTEHLWTTASGFFTFFFLVSF